MFEVRDNNINIFEDLPQGDGFCLALLSDEERDVTKRVRRHIGHGFQLTREEDGIWLYNRSQYVLFTGSPTIQLESIEQTNPVVKRIPSGCSIKVIDPELMSQLRIRQQEKRPGTTHCIRVSFAKGWGENYTRMSITSCPCWVEIRLNDEFL